jgi:ribosomal protein L29
MAKQGKQQKPGDLSVDQLQKEVGELKGLQFQQRFEKSTGKLQNYRLIPQAKKRLAAVLTALREKELAAQGGGQRSGK